MKKSGNQTYREAVGREELKRCEWAGLGWHRMGFERWVDDGN